MSPLPSTRVVHRDWSTHHRPAARGTMTATCTITGAGTPGTWTPEDGLVPGTADVLYTGPCRVQVLARAGRDADAAGQDVAQHPYLVAIDDLTVDVPTGDTPARVRVTECADDPALAGAVLTVAEVRYGSLAFQRDLICDLDPANQEG